MKQCIICGKPSDNFLRDLWCHFKPLDIEECKTIHLYVKGNISTTGSIIKCLLTCLYCISPLVNTLVFWKHRKSYIVIPAGGIDIEKWGEK